MIVRPRRAVEGDFSRCHAGEIVGDALKNADQLDGLHGVGGLVVRELRGEGIADDKDDPVFRDDLRQQNIPAVSHRVADRGTRHRQGRI